MLSAMRSFAKTKLAFVVFGILIVAMAVGVGFSDPFSGVSGGGFIRAGNHSVGQVDVARVLDQRIREAREESGEFITQEQAAERGMVQDALQELFQRSSFLAFADSIGVKASPKAVAELFADAPAFRDTLGRVDMASLQRVAQEQGFRNVRDFEEDTRKQLTQDYIVSAAFAGLDTPSILIRPHIAFFGERRTLSVARLTGATVIPPAAPAEEELTAFYEERKDMFAIPELRRLTVLAYSADDFLDAADLGEDLVRSEYDRRIKEFSEPETREFVELVSANRNDIQTLVDSVKMGQTVEQAASALPSVTLTARTAKPEEITDEQYRGFVFGIPAGDIVGPVQVENQWQAVIVRTITPGVATPFEVVRDRLQTEMARQEAERRFSDSYEQIYDLVGGGAPLEQMADEIGVPLIELAPVDQRGIAVTGGRSSLLARYPDAMRTMFALSAGEVSDVIEIEGGRAVMRLEEIVPARTMSLEEVRGDLDELYRTAKIQEAAQTAINQAVEAVKAGQEFHQAATAARLAAIDVPEITRISAGQTFDPAVLTRVFELSAGETVSVADSRGEPWVVRVNTIAPAAPEAEALISAQVGGEVTQSVRRDLEQAFLMAVQESVKVKSNEQAIRRYIDSFKRTDE